MDFSQKELQNMWLGVSSLLRNKQFLSISSDSEIEEVKELRSKLSECKKLKKEEERMIGGHIEIDEKGLFEALKKCNDKQAKKAKDKYNKMNNEYKKLQMRTHLYMLETESEIHIELFHFEGKEEFTLTKK